MLGLRECDIACYILHIRQIESEFSGDGSGLAEITALQPQMVLYPSP